MSAPALGNAQRDDAADVVCVIVHYGDPALSARAVASVARGEPRPRLILIVDNGPGVLSASAIEEAAQGVKVRFIRPGGNMGFAAGVQLALNHPDCAAAAAVWLLNNDATAQPQALAELLSALRDASGRALLSSRILTEEGGVWFERAVFYPWLAVARHPRRGSRGGRRPSWLAVPYLPACSLLVPADLTHEIGGFDPTFFLYGEDVDLSIRAARAGWELVVVPGSTVVHAASSGTRAEARERMMAASSVRLTARYFPILLPVALPAALLVALARGARNRSLTVVAARLAGLGDGLAAVVGPPRGSQ